jgi:putative aldouronate transport system substrate-binding protein
MATGMTLAGCGSDSDKEGASPAAATGGKEAPVSLIWYLRGSPPKNVASVTAKANEMIQAKINATVDFKFVEPGDYDQRMQLIMAAAEPFDIAWTSNWSNDYVNNVNKGAFLALDDYLAKFPKLKQSMPDKVWEATKVNGKNYGVFNYQILTLPHAFSFRKDMVDKYKLDLSNIKSMKDLTPVFETIKAKEPDMVPLKFGVPNMGVAMDGTWLPVVENFEVDPATWKVQSYFWTSDKIFPYYELMREWYTKGFFPQNVATVAEGDQALSKAGKLFAEYASYKPGVDAELAAKMGYEVKVVQMAPAPLLGKLTSTLNSISRTSKNPEKALALLELVNTDKELYNLLTFGIENQDYKKVGDNRIEKIPDTYQFDAWQLGNQFNAYLLPGQPDDVWEQTMKLNDTAKVNPLIDFSFNRAPVENELVQINAIFKEFNVILKNGLDDPANSVQKFKEKLKLAGEEKVKAEIQKQIDEWRKTQK